MNKYKIKYLDLLGGSCDVCRATKVNILVLGVKKGDPLAALESPGWVGLRVFGDIETQETSEDGADVFIKLDFNEDDIETVRVNYNIHVIMFDESVTKFLSIWDRNCFSTLSGCTVFIPEVNLSQRLVPIHRPVQKIEEDGDKAKIQIPDWDPSVVFSKTKTNKLLESIANQKLTISDVKNSCETIGRNKPTYEKYMNDADLDKEANQREELVSKLFVIKKMLDIVPQATTSTLGFDYVEKVLKKYFPRYVTPFEDKDPTWYIEFNLSS